MSEHWQATGGLCYSFLAADELEAKWRWRARCSELSFESTRILETHAQCDQLGFPGKELESWEAGVNCLKASQQRRGTGRLWPGLSSVPCRFPAFGAHL